MFGIEVAAASLGRECDLGHMHDWDAFYIRSTVPIHLERKRPARSLFAWWKAPEGEYLGRRQEVRAA